MRSTGRISLPPFERCRSPRSCKFYSLTDAEPITRAVAYRDGFEAWAMCSGSTEKFYTGTPMVAAYAAARDLLMIKHAFKARAVSV
jgi:hypothetical protein